MPPADPRRDEQPELLPGLVRATLKESQAKARATRERKRREVEIAEVDPVARVLVDVPLAHLDRPFDYAVPAAMADDARPGVRVKVRFAGHDVDGFLVERAASSDHPGVLQPLRRVVSPEPVLLPGVAALTAAVAERYAGARADVLRLAVPPRHAGAEKEAVGEEPSGDLAPLPPAAVSALGAQGREAWAQHPHGAAFLAHLAEGGAPRAVWGPPPGADWPHLLALAALGAPGGAVLCLPDGKDVARVAEALERAAAAAGLPPQHAVLTADTGPAQRYRAFLQLSRGSRRIAVGTRAAAFAPVARPGLVAIWDDGDDNHAEQRAPYPHAREVLLLRAAEQGSAALVGGFTRTVEGDHLVRTGWARELVADRGTLRRAVTVTVAGASEHDLRRDPHARTARLPTQVRDLVRDALGSGPVLVSVPRGGYAASLACERCRTPARCAVCSGPLHLRGAADPPACRWCATPAPGWACPECGHRGLRAPVVGDARTAEELGRSFPGTRVRTSSAGGEVLARVEARPAIVVATPGAEPVAEGGYAAVVLLDTWLALARTDLRTTEEALRRWANAVGLVAPGGRALAVGDPAHPALQALVRWDPAGFAEREAEERRSAHLPPASRLATISGPAGAVDDALVLLAAPEGAEVLGPVPEGEGPDHPERVVVRVPRHRGPELSRALGDLQRLRSSRKLDPVRIQVDPPSLG
ncbi:primosomal protein N' [Nocardioides sp. P86]|uniref:primosomal protein N' n=1 Tax=Nocardioides sp. P86 TaxID=2939569 RepID=UPI0020410C6F|nr:primosomal protein N' [Nocardioides sp. P86]MCM3513666.1 primosomal protein N' [Nocardioides sp. P86]